MTRMDDDIELDGAETVEDAGAVRDEDDDPESLEGDEVDDDLDVGVAG
jgi:hypothetical protein